MNGKVKVAAAHATDYQPQTIERATDEILAQLGGLESLVPKDAKVFVKVNLVRDMPAGKMRYDTSASGDCTGKQA